MGILDEAIREHLELKRQHGAEEPELKKLEDEALGPPGGAGELEEPPEMSEAEAEAPTDYIGSPAAAPPAPEEVGADEAPESEVAASEPEAATPAPDLRPPEMRPEEPPPSVAESEAEPEAAAEQPAEVPPAEEEDPAMEHEVPEPAAPDSAPETSAEAAEPPPVDAGGVSADLRAEREEIAQHPTEHYDVEEEIAEAEKEAAGFFNEQSLSDELDQALDAPDAAPPTEEGEVADPADEVEVIEEAEEAAELEEPDAIEAEEIVEADVEEVEEIETASEEERPSEEEPPAQGEQGDPGSAEEDVLEETPEFLQDSPEHDRLWFEQKPPKDFDFDD